MKNTFHFFFFFLIIILFNYSSSQIFINPMGDDSGPTIITRQTIRVRSNDGTPVTITKINIHSGRNINGGDDRLTPFDLMRIADSRMNDFFEALISRHLQLFNAIEREEEKEREKEKENNNNENKKEENNNNENNNSNNDENNDKEFELDEEKEENKNDNINKDNKSEIKEENKDNKEENNEKKSKDNKEKDMRKIGKLKVSEESIKNMNKKNNKKKGKKLSKKEIIFSRVCKYIFYSIILFTIYILVKKLLEILEIIDPESSGKNAEVDINNKNTNNEEKKEKIENDIIVNKERENKQN